jgi:D-alanyl-D-alanine carboxypeptidase (penicillin-binding protein 5/6)
VLVKKEEVSGLTQEVTLPEEVAAPVAQGQQLGTLTVRDGETVVLEVPILAAESVEKLTWWEMYRRMLAELCFRG